MFQNSCVDMLELVISFISSGVLCFGKYNSRPVIFFILGKINLYIHFFHLCSAWIMGTF